MMFTAPMFLNTNLGIYRYIASPMEFYICPHACAWVPAFIQRRRVWAAPSCLTAMAIGRDHIGLVVKRLAALHVPKASCFFFISSYIYILLSTMLTNTWFRSCTGWVAILASVTSCTGHFDILDLPWLTHHGSKTGLKPMQVFIMLVVLVAFAENLPQFEEDLSENTTFLLYLYSLHDGSQRI